MLKQHLSFLLICSTLASSKPDSCDDVDCNSGNCNSGICICETGYEGANCEIQQRLAFVGNYNVSETCGLESFNYIIIVTADSEITNELTIRNLGNFDFDVIANVDGNTFSLDSVEVTGGTIYGSASLYEGLLNISYEFETTSGQAISCNMECTLIE